jgi:FkbM family methyltransferase
VVDQVFLRRGFEGDGPQGDRLQRRYDALVRAGRTPVIVDCGAYAGFTSVWFAQRYPAATVIAVEPEPGNFAALALNASGYNTIRPVHGAVAAARGRVSLVDGGGGAWAWRTRADPEGEVEAVTIDDLLAGVDGGTCFIVKVDIEGAEAELFAGGAGWLGVASLAIVEPHDELFAWRGTTQAAFAALAAHGGWDVVVKAENLFCYSHRLEADADGA